MRLSVIMLFLLCLFGCDRNEQNKAKTGSPLFLASCTNEIISSVQSGKIVRQQAIVLHDSVLFDVLESRFSETFSGIDRKFGGEHSILKRLKNQTNSSHGDKFSWSFIVVGDTISNKDRIANVSQQLLASGVPDYCIYQMTEVEARVGSGFSGFNYPKD